MRSHLNLSSRRHGVQLLSPCTSVALSIVRVISHIFAICPLFLSAPKMLQVPYTNSRACVRWQEPNSIFRRWSTGLIGMPGHTCITCFVSFFVFMRRKLIKQKNPYIYQSLAQIRCQQSHNGRHTADRRKMKSMRYISFRMQHFHKRISEKTNHNLFC